MAQRKEQGQAERPPLIQIVGANVFRVRRSKMPPMARRVLYELSGVAVNTIEALERSADPTYRGKVNQPSLYTIERLAEGLGVDPAELLRWDEATRRYLSGIPSLQAVPGSGHPDPDRPRQRPLLVPVRKT